MASLDEVIFAIDTTDNKLCTELFTKTETSINVILPNKYTPLTYSIFKNNLTLAMKLLSLGADTETFDSHKKNPMYYAVRYNHIDFVEQLLNKGANCMDEINIDKWTPFHLACSMGHTKIVQLMLLETEGKHVNAITIAGQTPLHLTANGGFSSILKMLLDHGAVADAKDSQRKQTPLHLAAQRGHTECCVLLLKKDARLHEPDHTVMRKTPLELARDCQQFATAAAMIKTYNRNAE